MKDAPQLAGGSFTLFAGGLHKYPFEGRLLLFLVPAMMMFIGEGVDRIMILARPTGRIVWVSLCVLLFLVPVQKAISTLLNPARMDKEEVRPVMTYLSQHYQKGDKLYLYHSSEPAFKYYANRYGLEDAQLLLGVTSPSNWPNYVNDLKNLDENERIWILFSHVMKNNGIDEESFFYMFWMEWEGRLIYLHEKALPSIFMTYTPVLSDRKGWTRLSKILTTVRRCNLEMVGGSQKNHDKLLANLEN